VQEDPKKRKGGEEKIFPASGKEKKGRAGERNRGPGRPGEGSKNVRRKVDRRKDRSRFTKKGMETSLRLKGEHPDEHGAEGELKISRVKVVYER